MSDTEPNGAASPTHPQWNPLQSIGAEAQAIRMVRSGMVIAFFMALDGVQTIIEASGDAAAASGLDPRALVPIGVGQLILALSMGAGLALSQAWWAIGMAVLWSGFVMWVRLAALNSGEQAFNIYLVVLPIIYLVILTRVVRGKLALQKYRAGADVGG
jgi:hypothetical protein